MRLQYEISINGRRMASQMRSVERELAAAGKRANARVAADARKLAARPIAERRTAARDTGTKRRVKSELQMRMRADAQFYAERRRLSRDQHRRSLRQIQREGMAQKRAAQAARATFARGVGRGTAGALRGVAGVGGGILGIGGGFAAVGAIRDQIGVEAAASVLANKALGTSGDTRSRSEIRAATIAQARDLGATSGLGAQGILGGLSKFHGISGNMRVGQAIMPFLADLADATGADIGDVGRTGGQITQAMGARGYTEAESIAKTKEILGAMAGQAKVGSIEFADLATQMGKVMSATAAFDGDIGELATTMGAISQLAVAGAASSPQEAMTAMLRFRDDLMKNQGRFEKVGVSTFTDKSRTQLRDPVDIMIDTLRATKGDLVKSGKLFGIRGMKAFQPFQSTFVKAGGGMKGVEAMSDMLARVRASKMSVSEVETSAKFRRGDPDKQLAIAVEKFQAAVGEKLVPAVTAAIPAFEDLIPAMAGAAEGTASLAKWFLENPFTGIGAIVAASISREIASSGLQAMLRTSLGTKLAGAAGTATVALAALAAGIAAIDWVEEHFKDKRDAEFAADIQDVNFESKMAAKVRGGKALTEDESAHLERLRDRKRGIADTKRSATSSFGAIAGGFGTMSASTGKATDAQGAQVAAAEADASRLSEILMKSAANQEKGSSEFANAAGLLERAAASLERSTNQSRGQSMVQRGAWGE